MLDPNLAAKIAAGEVVERPASVVKELVENSLDAGATVVQVELRSGGIQLMRVTDDGAGILEEELELAFERHATSKLSSLEDLQKIQSLGFRGEALPSIRSVASVSVVSRPAESDFAAFVRFEHGLLAEKGRRGAPIGTQIAVRNMFESIPARLRFLRQPSTEASQAVNVVVQYALAFPHVRFSVEVDGRTAFRSPGTGLLSDAMLAAYGKEVASALIEVASDLDASRQPVQLAGLTTKPAVNRGNRAGISFFINRRWVQSRPLTQAVESAYQNRLMVGRHPIGVFHLAIPFESVDVNVHPAKTEVRLLAEREAFTIVQRAVKDALERAIDIPAMSSVSLPGAGQTILEGSSSSSEGIQARIDLGLHGPEVQPEKERIPALRLVGQVGTTYLIAEGLDGMYLVDQHAAHERVMYEIVRSRLDRGEIEAQGLLEPVIVELSVEQAHRLEQSGDTLAGFGFDLEKFGENSVAVRAVPAVIRPARAESTVVEAIDSLSGNPSEWRDKLAATVACHAAVRAGQLLSEEEMRQLLVDLEKTANPRSCPHGRPTMLHLSAAQIEREFGRR